MAKVKHEVEFVPCGCCRNLFVVDIGWCDHCDAARDSRGWCYGRGCGGCAYCYEGEWVKYDPDMWPEATIKVQDCSGENCPYCW